MVSDGYVHDHDRCRAVILDPNTFGPNAHCRLSEGHGGNHRDGGREWGHEFPMERIGDASTR